MRTDDDPGHIDYDAGYSATGSAHPGGPDPQCVGKPWRNSERRATPYGLNWNVCGLSFELVLLLPPVVWLWRRKRRAAV